MRKLSRLILAVILMTSLLPGSGFAQQPTVGQRPSGPSIGVVTALKGEALVGRAVLPQPTLLRFKDDVFFRDQITTREKATVRLLLGGKGTLTIREQSQVTLGESTAPDGTRHSVLGVVSGKIAAAVSRALMKPGETLEIRTPNAVAAVRGTVLIAEYIPPTTSAEGPTPTLLASTDAGTLMAQALSQPAGGQSNFWVLQGNVTVTVQGQPPVALGPMQAVSVRVTPAGAAQVGPVQTVTPQQAVQATQGLQTQKQHTGEAETSKTAQAQTQVAAAVATAIVAAATGQSAPTTTDTTLTQSAQESATGATGGTAPAETTGTPSGVSGVTTTTTTNNTVADITPTLPTAAINTLPAGNLVNVGSGSSVAVADGVQLMTFGVGAPNTVAPVSLSGTATAPAVNATGTTITHDGALVSLGPTANLSGPSAIVSPATAPAPVIQVSGTTLTNTGAPAISLGGGALTVSGPVLNLESGGTANLAGVVQNTGGQVAVGPVPAVSVSGGSTLTTTAPAFALSGGANLSAASGGTLVDVDPSTLTLGGYILDMSGASTAGHPVPLGGSILHSLNSTVTGSSGGLLALRDTNTLFFGGTSGLLLGEGSTISFSVPMVTVAGGALASFTGRVATMSGGQLSAAGLLVVDSNSTASFSGGSAAGGSIFQGENGAQVALSGSAITVLNSPASLHSAAAGAPMLNMIGGTLTLTGGGATSGALLTVDSSMATSNGPLLRTSGTTVTATGMGGPLVRIANSGTASSPGLIVTGGESLFTFAGGTKVTMAGSALQGANSHIALDAPLFNFLGASTLTLSGGPVVLLTGGSLTATGGIGRSDESGNQITVAGTMLDATGATVTFNARTTPEVTGSLDLVNLDPGAGKPQIRLAAGSSYTDHDPDGLMVELPERGTAAAPKTYAGLLLDSSNSAITLDGTGVVAGGSGGKLADVCCGNVVKTSESALPLIRIARDAAGTASDVKTYSHVVGIFGGDLTVGSPLLKAAGTATAPVKIESTTGLLLGVMQGSDRSGTVFAGRLTSTATSGALLDLTNTIVSMAAPLIGVQGVGSIISLKSTLVSMADSSITVTPASTIEVTPVLGVAPGATIEMTGSSAPLITLSGGSISLVSIDAQTAGIGLGNPRSANPAAEPVATITTSGGLLKATGTSFVSGALAGLPHPFVGLTHSNLTTGGPILDLANVTLDLGTQPVVGLSQGSQLTVGSGPALRMVGGSLTAQALVFTDGAANRLTFTGPVADLTDMVVTLGRLGGDPQISTDVDTFNTATGVPFLQMLNSSLTVTESNHGLVDPGSGPGADDIGLGLLAKYTTGANKTLSLGGPLLNLFHVNLKVATGETIPATGPQAYIQLDGMNVLQTTPPAPISQTLIRVQGTATEASTTQRPLLQARNTQFGTATSPLPGAFLGVESGASLTSTAPSGLVQLDGSSVTVGGPFLATMDAALLNASAPIVNLLNSTLQTANTAPGLMDLFRSSVTAIGPMFTLDNSNITINNGPLMTVHGGTQMTVNGDFARLTNGSKIVVQNGPMIFVDGINPVNPASPTRLHITGGLVNFGTSSGNQVIINNAIAPTGSFTSNGVTVPVSMTGGATINTGAQAITNPGSNLLSATGSVIRGTNGAKIGINAAP